MCVCVCMCVCMCVCFCLCLADERVRAREWETWCVRVRECLRECLCAPCVCARTRGCVCVWVCVWVCAGVAKGDRKKEQKRRGAGGKGGANIRGAERGKGAAAGGCQDRDALQRLARSVMVCLVWGVVVCYDM